MAEAAGAVRVGLGRARIHASGPRETVVACGTLSQVLEVTPSCHRSWPLGTGSVGYEKIGPTFCAACEPPPTRNPMMHVQF